MRTLTRLPLALGAIAAFNLTGAVALAEPQVPNPFQPDSVFTADLCDPVEQICSEPDPEPVPNPDIPDGPGDLTDDPCDPVEQICGDGPGDPETNPDIPDGPGSFTDDPCDPVEQACGDSDPEPEPEAELDPELEPELCPLDEVCTRTPTFTA